MSMHRALVKMLCASCVSLSLNGMYENPDKNIKRFSCDTHFMMYHAQELKKQEFKTVVKPYHGFEYDVLRNGVEQNVLGMYESHIQYLPTPTAEKKQEQKLEKIRETGSVFQPVYSVAGWMKSWWSSQPDELDFSEHELIMLNSSEFDWKDPYVVKKPMYLKDGVGSYLQWYVSHVQGIEVYDADARRMIIKKVPIIGAVWENSYSYYCVVRQQDGAEPQAIIYDFKNRTEHVITPCSKERYGFFGSNDNVRFVTTINDGMYITHFRPERKTHRVFRKDCEIARSFFCDTHLWVLYKNKQNLKQTLVVYDIRREYQEIKEIAVDGRLVRPWDWYGSPKDKNYLSLCSDGMLHIYDMTTGELKYHNKQRPAVGPYESLIGIWNSDGSRYVITNDAQECFVTTHDVNNKQSFELYRVNNKSIVCDRGFQNQFVAVRVVDDQVDHTLFRFYDSDTGLTESTLSCKGKLAMHGYGAQNCYIAVSDEELIIFRYRENNIRLQKKHNGLLGLWWGTGENSYCVMVQDTTMLLLDFKEGSVKEVSYNDILRSASFNKAGDKIMLSYGHKVDIMKNPTAEVITTLDLGEFTAQKTLLSPDGKICAVWLQDDETIINVYNAQTGTFIVQLGYCDDIDHMQFNEQGTLFVVTTETETHSYSVK